MSNEIKEILDRLERIDHKEYSCGFEFADSGSFDEDCRCFEERKKMAKYITNLQEQLEKTEECRDELLEVNDVMRKLKERYQHEKHIYKIRIEKAIEILKLCNSQCAKETIDILNEVE